MLFWDPNIVISNTDSLKFNDYVTIQINWQELLNLPQLSLAVLPPTTRQHAILPKERGGGEGGVYVGGCQRVLAIYLYIIQRFVELNSQSFTGNRNANAAGRQALQIQSQLNRANLLINSCRALMRAFSLCLSLIISLPLSLFRMCRVCVCVQIRFRVYYAR